MTLTFSMKLAQTYNQSKPLFIIQEHAEGEDFGFPSVHNVNSGLSALQTCETTIEHPIMSAHRCIADLT